jgi:endonuclease/exonuclease/phosphatase family metal-dependent hydrolase
VLPWHSAPGGKTWQRNVEEGRRQANEWRALRGSGEFADHWFCIAGDFNMTLHRGRGYGNDDARAAIQEGLESVGLTCHTAIDIRSPQFGGFSRDNIDHICLDNRLSLKTPVEFWSGESRQGKLSDHNGVVVEIGFP